MSIQSYRDLRVWQLAMDLAVDAYKLTTSFPADERYGMSSQIRRSAASVPANVAEGYGRDNRGMYVQQLRIAQGSLKELETHILLAQRIGILSEEEARPALDQCDDVGRMLRSLIRSLQSKD
ncbi:MAG: four helix bundle protein [Hyphomicrobiaceae bacterium]|nr:MAG: four helix bundle protein [Hyphomicrobiaceae bacterium]